MKLRIMKPILWSFLSLTILFLLSCSVNENPTCKDISVTLNKKSNSYKGNHTITSVTTNDSTLKRIIITDSEGWNPVSMILYAPADENDKRCKFVYPANQSEGQVEIFYSGNVFTKTENGGATIFTAENVNQRVRSGETTVTTLYCPVEKHLGKWTLEIEYPLGVTEGDLPTKDLEICFEWGEE